MDGVIGLEEGAKAIFPHVMVQRCIVHLIRNSIKYVPNKDYKRFTAQLKKVYGAASLKASESEFERFRQTWSQYPGAVDVWVRNWQHVAQLFSYGSAVRKILYTTNAVESVNSSFRKVTKKGAFPNENALLKLLYLRISELYKKLRKILYTTNAVESVNSSFRKVTKKGAFPNENALLKLLYLRISELYKKWKNIDHRLRMLDAADQVEEAGLLGEAYERLISSYQKARGLNDEMEELVKDALIN